MGTNGERKFLANERALQAGKTQTIMMMMMINNDDDDDEYFCCSFPSLKLFHTYSH